MRSIRLSFACGWGISSTKKCERASLTSATRACPALDVSPRAWHRDPWNKGKLIGPKPPLCPKHVWSIRSKLHAEGRKRDLAMFNLAIDSKLGGCDIVRLMVQDIAPQGRRRPVRQYVRRRLAGLSASR